MGIPGKGGFQSATRDSRNAGKKPVRPLRNRKPRLPAPRPDRRHRRNASSSSWETCHSPVLERRELYEGLNYGFERASIRTKNENTDVSGLDSLTKSMTIADTSSNDPDVVSLVCPASPPSRPSTAVLSARGCVSGSVVPQKRKSLHPPASSPPLSPISVQPVEHKSPPQFEEMGTLDGLGHGEPRLPHSSHASQRQSRDDSPFDDIIMEITTQAWDLSQQQLRAMCQPYCHCDNGSSRADGVDFDAIREDLREEMEWLTSSRRKSQKGYHKTQAERDELIEPRFSMQTPPEWPRPSYRDYSESAELKLQDLLTGKYVSNLSVQRAEESWRAQVPGDNEIKIQRYYWIDSICMELDSFKAITKPSIRLCLVPCSTSAVPPDCILTDGVKPHRHQNIRLLELNDDRCHIHLVFPKLMVDSNSKATNALTDDQHWRRHLIDKYILPALRQTLPKECMKEWPHSFDSAVATASDWIFNSSSEGCESVSKETPLLYGLQSEWLEPFWEDFKHRVAHPDCPYNGVKLLYLEDGLRGVTDSQDPAESMRQLRKPLAGFNWSHIPCQHSWVDFCLRDQISLPKTGPRTTLLYRADCLANLDHSACACFGSPWVGFTPRKYTQYLMRDVGSMEEVREDDDAKEALNSHTFIRQFRAYNAHKVAEFSANPPFSQEKFRQLLVNYQLDAQLSAASSHGHSHINHAGSLPTFKSVFDSWNDEISTVSEDLDTMTGTDFGVLRRLSINPHVLLALLDEELVSELCPPGPTRSLDPPEGNGHSPFFAVSTSELNHFLDANFARFIFAIHHMASCVKFGGGAQNLVATPNHTQQLSMMRLNRVLVDLLMFTLSSVDCAKEPWLFDSQLLAYSPDRADDATRMEQGLGVKRTIDERGMAFLESFAVDLIFSSSSTAADANITWPFDLSERHAKSQAQPQAGTSVLSESGEVVNHEFVSGSISGLHERLTKHGLESTNGTTSAPAYFSQAESGLTNSRAVMVEPSEHVSDVMTSSRRTVQPPSTVPASRHVQHMPPAADSNNSNASNTRQDRQAKTTAPFSTVAAQHLETQTGKKPEAHSTDLTTDQPRRLGSINGSLGTAEEPVLRSAGSAFFHSMLDRLKPKNDLNKAAGLDSISTKGREG